MSKRKKLKMKSSDVMKEIVNKNTPFVYREAFKTLRTNLSFVSLSGQYKKILITSALPSEGKSTVCINLASNLAESGAKVILLDGDLRNPSLHRYLRIENRDLGGLSGILAGTAQYKKCILSPDNEMNIDFIPAGTIPPNPAELLSSQGMDDLLTVLAQEYDYIICDTPPVGVVTDAAALSKFCDGAILVIRQKFASREMVRNAKHNLEKVQANLLGAVMTHYELTEDLKQSRGYYGYYQYQYGDKATEPER